ncbi:MAG: L,D-transpeptidase family protein [Cardiobacteriaceae bacterium]|nr:L,D-transpeptidase family protein [Cardiobacteriaceae bacterium]
MNKFKKSFLIALIFAGLNLTAYSEKFQLPPADVDLIGMVRQVPAPQEKTLYDIGREYGVGYEAMKNANPNVDMQLPNPDGSDVKVLVPTRYILPNNVPRDGIVINLPEMRLYYFPPDKQSVYVFAVGIGREDWASPVGVHKITAKTPNPTWTPPASIRREHAAQGDILPAVVPAGPDNPLGLFAMRLSAQGYLLHGTNKPDGVGMRVSHGCIRMYPEGIEELFQMATVGTKVTIIKQEMKIGMYGDELYLEYHPPISEDNISPETAMHRAIEKVHQEAAKHGWTVEEDLIRAVVNEASGMPVAVSYSTGVSAPAENSPMQENAPNSPANEAIPSLESAEDSENLASAQLQ